VATLSAYQAVDFDDLIRLPVELFRHNEAVRDKWQRRLRYLLVDEYQDTNTCQYELVKLLVTGIGKKPMFTAVGDDDQAIYAWRGATIENLKTLQVDFPDLRIIKLEQNYRSTTRILQAANAVIGNNPNCLKNRCGQNTASAIRSKSCPCMMMKQKRKRSRCCCPHINLSGARIFLITRFCIAATIRRG
jgi:superfamily I DNA/RNA helicase